MMKLSIWQEFSSNNSARFTIVGVFRSPHDAQLSAQKLRDILDNLTEWHIEHPAESDNIAQDVYEGNITPVERSLSEQYRIDWEFPVLWGSNYTLDVFDRFIFIYNNWGADSGADPIDRLVLKLGAYEVTVSGSMIWNADDRHLDVSVSATAPTEKIAEMLVSEMENASLGMSKALVRVHIDNITFTLSNVQVLKNAIKRLQDVNCTDISVRFEERRDFRVDLSDEE